MMPELRIRVSEAMLEAIDLAVKIGSSNNRSDFVRAAIKEALERLTVFEMMKKRKLS
jgi:Arc/MetJ-type ribon-helix-helix transcriptional regulator